MDSSPPELPTGGAGPDCGMRGDDREVVAGVGPQRFQSEVVRPGAGGGQGQWGGVGAQANKPLGVKMWK